MRHCCLSLAYSCRPATPWLTPSRRRSCLSANETYRGQGGIERWQIKTLQDRPRLLCPPSRRSAHERERSQPVAGLVKPGLRCALYLNDGTTARISASGEDELLSLHPLESVQPPDEWVASMSLTLALPKRGSMWQRNRMS